MGPIRIEPERLAPPDGLVAALVEGRIQRDLALPLYDRRAEPVPRGPLQLPPDVLVPAGPEAEARRAAVLSGQGVVVTTGQQPQLFGGPLYVLYKALSALRRAAEVEAEHGVPCLAVFWVASDDHDWDEVGSVGFLDDTERPATLRIPPPPGRERRPVGPSPLPPDIAQRVDTFLARIGTRPAGASWAAGLREAYVAGRSFSDAFRRLLQAWLGDQPLAFVDSAHPAIRRAAVPLIGSVFEAHDEVEAALERGSARVERAGHVPQLAYLEGATPVLRETESGRQRLYRGGEGFRTASADFSLGASELLADLGASPDSFSPSAALRPVLESSLLPVHAAVLGPGEIAYWAQLGPLFEVLDVAMPRVCPRGSWRVVERRIERLLEKTGLTAEELAAGTGSVEADLVEHNRPRHLEDALRTLESGIAEGFASVEAATAEERPGLRSAAGKARSRVREALESFHRTVDARTRERLDTKLAQVRRAARHLYPGGAPQERVLSPLYYLLSYGDLFLDEVHRVCLAGPDAGDSRGDSAVAADSEGR